MNDFLARVRRLSDAAWALRRACPAPKPLPFALALFSDDRRGPDILGMAKALPPVPQIPPLAVIFRHDSLTPDARRHLAMAVRDMVQARGHLFVMARSDLPGADGCHAITSMGRVRTWPVHNGQERMVAARAGADAGFISPVFATRSHPGARGLGPARAIALAARAPFACLALGGMTTQSARRLQGTPFQGFGAIGAFGSGQP